MERRLARGEDIPALAALERACFPEGADEAMLERFLSDGRHRFLLAEEDGTLLGYAWYEFVLDEGYVGNVAVAAEHRRQGVGRALVADMLSDAASLGLAFLTLEVRESNLPAQSLYRALGFLAVGRRKRYYEDNGEDALIMVCDRMPPADPDFEEPETVHEEA